MSTNTLKVFFIARTVLQELPRTVQRSLPSPKSASSLPEYPNSRKRKTEDTCEEGGKIAKIGSKENCGQNILLTD